MTERPALLCTNGWEGRREHRVTVIDETRTKYVFRAEEDFRAGRYHYQINEIGYAPKYAFRFDDEAAA